MTVQGLVVCKRVTFKLKLQILCLFVIDLLILSHQ